MKTKAITYILGLIAIVNLNSCSEEEYFNTSAASENQIALKSDVTLFEFSNQSLNDELTLELDIPDNSEGSLLYFVYYNQSSDKSENIVPIPNINLDKGYKIYYTRETVSSDSKISITLIAEQSNLTQPFGGKIDLTELKVLAVKPSAIKNLTRNDLDFRDYNEVIEYFRLK